MKKISLTLLLSGIIILGLTGCGTKDVPSQKELDAVNDKIVEYFLSEDFDYENYCFNYVDESKRKVIVDLLDNSKEQQDKIKELTIDSNLIEFVKCDDRGYNI